MPSVQMEPLSASLDLDQEQKWEMISFVRQLHCPISLLGKSRLSCENQKWVVENCLDEPLAKVYPRGINFER